MSYSKKHIVFNFSFLRRHVFSFSAFLCYFWCASKNTCFILPLGPWACHCGPTLRPPGPARANPLHVFPVFFVSHFFNLFGLLRCPPGQKWTEEASTNDPFGLFLKLFGTHAANKTHTSQPHACKLQPWPGGMRVSD